jgi:hypothetical protein
MNESGRYPTGWIAPDDTFYACGEYSHTQWALRFRAQVEETGVVFPPNADDDMLGKLELAMVQKGWIRKANRDAYYLRPQDRRRAIDYALEQTHEHEIYLDYITGKSEMVPLVRHSESCREIARRMFLLG